ncbi:MAG: mannitol dehydrogenase family protein [Pseudomonadota bacterium]
MPVALSAASLDALPARVRAPRHDRAALTPGILHVGVGNFHRAHQAVYLDDLFGQGRDHDWGILGAGVMPGDARVRAALEGQDFLTTVVEQSVEASHARVTAPMTGFLPVADGPAITAALADPAIRIVSLTVTEGGYFIDGTGAFDAAHPAIAADAAAPEAPCTVFGLILAGLARRRAAGHAPFTVMSCDNIPHNGDVVRRVVTGLADLVDPALGAWVGAEVAFPNSMVDRITPATGARERRLAAEAHGIEDAWPVFCEDFRQWVLEDRFPAGRPALEEVGVQFVTDVTPFELMKIRVLNGGHAAIAYPAALLGIEFAHEAMAEPLVARFLARLHREEIVPTIPPVPDTDIAGYVALIGRRFANPKIADTVRRLAHDGSNRQPRFIVPTLADRLEGGGGIEGLALVSALWCRYCHGTTESGATVEPNDPAWEALQARARTARETPDAWLAMREVYGDTGEHPRFRTAFAEALGRVWDEGTAAALAAYGRD